MARAAARGRRGDGGADSPETLCEPREGVCSPLGALGATTPPFTQSERAFQGQVIAYARLMGWRVHHDNATNAPRRCPKCREVVHLPRNAPGLPDLILVRRPRVVWAELKSERGKLSDDQREWIEDLRASGQAAYVWRPSDWQEIERVLR